MRLLDLAKNCRTFLIACAIPVKDVDKALELADKAVSLGADLVEFRLDYLPASKDEELEEALNRILREFRKCKIITLREVSEGGAREIPQDTKIKLISKLYGVNNTFVDIEFEFLMRAQDRVDLTRLSGVIISKHYFYDKPSLGALQYMYMKVKTMFRNVDIFKIASIVSNDRDLILLLDFLTSVEEEVPYLAVLPMGNISRHRLIPLLLKSKLTYCSMTEKTAPGQIPVDICVEFRSLVEKIW